MVIWSTCGRFDPERGSAMGWMLTIAHRRAVDRARSAPASARRDDNWARHQFGWQGCDTTVEAAQASMEATRVRTALRSISDKQRTAIVLAYFGGQTYLQVAASLGIRRPRAASATRSTPLEPTWTPRPSHATAFAFSASGRESPNRCEPFGLGIPCVAVGWTGPNCSKHSSPSTRTGSPTSTWTPTCSPTPSRLRPQDGRPPRRQWPPRQPSAPHRLAWARRRASDPELRDASRH